ncbi:MAG: PTS sugar transporter subunit IIA, partial [Planctomycetota bacterium]
LGSWKLAHALAIIFAYILVSFLHILLGELIPKSVAIRTDERSSLATARPLVFFRFLLYLPLLVLNGAANGILRLLGFSSRAKDPRHTEEELRIILARSQSMGIMSFRRLLLLENVFDLGDLKVRDAMRERSGAKVLQVSAPWEENLKVIRETRFSRYPLVEEGIQKPLGVIHVKDLLYEGFERIPHVNLREIARPYTTAKEDSSLETLLADLQRHRGHMVIVLDEDEHWSGFITFEDIIEEIIGTIEDEFEVEPPLFLADTISSDRIFLDLKAQTVESAIVEAVMRVPSTMLPVPAETIRDALVTREKKMPTYIGRSVAIPHARIEGVKSPLVILGRSEDGIPVKGRKEKAHLIFMVISPTGQPRIQARLLTRIGGLMDSEYVEDRLREARSAKDVLEAIRAGDPVALS